MIRAGLFALAGLVLVSCAPEVAYDNVCDPQSLIFDPCACEPCPVIGTTCVKQASGGRTCECPHPEGWCVLDQLCCASNMMCRLDVTPPACCQRLCTGRECGDDGCGGSCGTCGCGKTCKTDGKCSKLCEGRECGDNGCGGECGKCPYQTHCSDDGKCIAD
jgi:hypothetical protein